MTWYAHRRDDGSVASLHREPQKDYAEEALADDAPEVLALFPAPGYRELRAAAYRDQLGKETGDYIKTLGDVLDTLIAEAAALAAAANVTTPDFAALLTKIQAVKTAIPKP